MGRNHKGAKSSVAAKCACMIVLIVDMDFFRNDE